MNPIWKSAAVGLLAVPLIASCRTSSPSTGSTPDAGSSSSACDSASADGASTKTQAIVDAANAFLATFTSTTSVQFPFTRPEASSPYVGAGNRLGEQYGSAVWSNYPVSDVPRPGVKRGDLSSAQQAAEDVLLKAALSDSGYTKITQIMGADQVLCNQGQNFTCGTAVYTIGIFGTPSTTSPWMIEFGGHHLGLNIVINGAQGTVAPTLTGTQPAVYTASDGTTVRVLAAENDKAFALLDSLDDTQRAQAITSATIGDLVLGPGHDNTNIVPEGVKGSSLTAAQKALLHDVIAEWVGTIDSSYACPHLAEIDASLDDTYFLWSGPTTHEANKNGSAYYRIQGPKVVIEFSPQGGGPGSGGTGGGPDGGMGGGPDGGMGGGRDGGMGGGADGGMGGGTDGGTGGSTDHVHTVYRDPTNEYGHTW